MKNKKIELLRRRQLRKRAKLVNSGRPRLCVFRSNRGIYAQIIDDSQGRTILGLASSSPDIRPEIANKNKTEAAAIVGSRIAQMALASNIKKVVFDSAGRKYHGRIKALADAARKAGLEF